MAKANIRNILKVANEATPEERLIGREWYQTAHRAAAELAEQHGVTMEQAAGVIAALSPNQPWSQNLIAAKKLLYAYANGLSLAEVTIAAYGLNKAKAWRICQGEPVLTVLKGNKVRSFFSNIAYPEAVGPVTVDGHAFAIWKGKRITTTSAQQRGLGRIGVYEQCAADYVTAAERVGLRPQELQAITWLAWRRKWGLK